VWAREREEVGYLVLSPVTVRFVPGDFVGGEGETEPKQIET